MKCSASYSIAVISDGIDGVGVKSITAYYALSTTPIQPDISTFATSPQYVDKDNRYLWYYEKTEYTDNRTPVETDPILMGVYGDTGKDGDSGPSPVDAVLSSYSVVLPCNEEGVINGTDLNVSVSVVQSFNYQCRPLSLATSDTLKSGQFKFSLTMDGITEVSASGLGIVGSSASVMLNNTAYIDVNFEYLDFYEVNGTTTKKICLSKSLSKDVIEGINKSIKETNNTIGLTITKGDDGNVNGYTLAGVSVGALDSSTGYIRLKGDAIIADGTISGKKIDVNSLFAREIVLNQQTFSDDGVEYPTQIRSVNFDRTGDVVKDEKGKAKQGFYLASDGTLKASGAVFSDVQITNGDADGAILNGNGLAIKGEAVIDSDSLSTANKDKAGDTISYTRSLPTAKYLTDLINAEVAKIAECATGSATSGTSFSMTYKGTTYSTPRKFSSHTQWLSSTFKPTSTGLTITQSFTIPSGQKGKASIGSNGSQDAYWYTEAYTDTHSVYVPAEYTYAWEVTSTYKGYDTKPDNESKPSNPSVGDKYFTYSSVTANTYYIYVNEYTKTKVSDSYWKDEEEYIPAEDGWNAMTLQSTTLTSGGTSYSFDTWLSAGTYTITQKWATYNSSTYDYTGTYRWRNNAYPVFYVYGSYSQYYGLGTFFGSTKWTDLASAWTSDDVSITRGGSVTLQAGSGYSTWTGATKRYYFSHSLTAGSWLIGSGTWNGSAVTSKTPLTISAQSVVFGQKTYNVGTYYTESEYLPTFSLVTIELQAGVHVASVFPKNSNTSLGSSTQPFAAVYSDGGAFSWSPTLGRCTLITSWNDTKKTGFYMANKASDGPYTDAWQYGIVLAYDSQWCMQTVYAWENHSDMQALPIYRRTCKGGSWSAWQEVNLSGNLNSADTSADYNVYGAKFTQTILYKGTIAGTVNLKEPMTKYQWIIVNGWLENSGCSFTPVVFHASNWGWCRTSADRFVFATDNKYCSFYFPAANQINHYNSNDSTYFYVYGIR